MSSLSISNNDKLTGKSKVEQTLSSTVAEVEDVPITKEKQMVALTLLS